MTTLTDTARAAEYRRLEQRLRTDADALRTKAEEATAERAPGGSVLADYQADVARHFTEMAATADFHADRAAEIAYGYEQDALQAGAA